MEIIVSCPRSLLRTRREVSRTRRTWISASGCALVMLAACAPVASASPSAAAPDFSSSASCRVGAFRSSGGEAVAVSKGATSGRFFYQFTDGRRDYVDSGDSPLSCATDGVRVRKPDGHVETWRYIAVRETPAEFVHDGITFHGLLVEPLGTEGRPPLIILGHGSERAGALPAPGAINPQQYLFAAQGISAFVFDKRGTGRSGGKFVMNFPKLADDMAAASVEARRLAEGRFSRFGFWGGSQGGWVAPLAARNTGADFVVVSFGLVMSPHEEEREEILADLTRRGFSGQALSDAGVVVDALGTLIASRFERGYERLAEVKQAYANEPWYPYLAERHGDLLNVSEAELRSRRGEEGVELDWYYDAMPVLRSSPVPLLWIIAAEDRIAPPRITLERLAVLQSEGKRIDLAVFPDTDHGMMEFTEAPDGTRTYTHITDGYFRLMGDWVKERLSPPYGRATLHRAPGM